MKNIFTLCLFLFIANLSFAQIPSSKEIVSPSNITKVASDLGISDEQITDAIGKDDVLQKDLINQMKTEAATQVAMAKLNKMTGGSQKSIIKSILGNKDLTKMAIDCIKNNPGLLLEAKKFLGL